MKKQSLILVAAAAFMAVAAGSASAQTVIAKDVFSAGYAATSDGAIQLDGVFGQSVIGASTDESIELNQGFLGGVDATGKPTAVPFDFALFQNFPNPFNPATTIDFEIGGKDVVLATLTVYTVDGREVGTIVSDFFRPGRYSFSFRALGLPSGNYFYHLTAGPYSKTRAMTLAK